MGHMDKKLPTEKKHDVKMMAGEAETKMEGGGFSAEIHARLSMEIGDDYVTLSDSSKLETSRFERRDCERTALFTDQSHGIPLGRIGWQGVVKRR